MITYNIITTATLTSVLTRRSLTVININLTVLTLESGRTRTHVRIELIRTRSTVLTRITGTFVDLYITV